MIIWTFFVDLVDCAYNISWLWFQGQCCQVLLCLCWPTASLLYLISLDNPLFFSNTRFKKKRQWVSSQALSPPSLCFSYLHFSLRSTGRCTKRHWDESCLILSWRAVFFSWPLTLWLCGGVCLVDMSYPHCQLSSGISFSAWSLWR